jgi:hypothetical protein
MCKRNSAVEWKPLHQKLPKNRPVTPRSWKYLIFHSACRRSRGPPHAVMYSYFVSKHGILEIVMSFNEKQSSTQDSSDPIPHQQARAHPSCSFIFNLRTRPFSGRLHGALECKILRAFSSSRRDFPDSDGCLVSVV